MVLNVLRNFLGACNKTWPKREGDHFTGQPLGVPVVVVVVIIIIIIIIIITINH